MSKQIKYDWKVPAPGVPGTLRCKVGSHDLRISGNDKDGFKHSSSMHKATSMSKGSTLEDTQIACERMFLKAFCEDISLVVMATGPVIAEPLLRLAKGLRRHKP